MFPAAEPLRTLMLQVGYRYVYYRLLMLGTMAVHVGVV
jgi:ubiquinone/menaquinone biosynthesis C-methylase UbiE